MGLFHFLVFLILVALIYAVGAFWKNGKAEEYIRAAADAEPNVRYVSLQHLHSDAYQAIGLFEHQGVAAHPSDRGMKEIASAIYLAMGEDGLVPPSILYSFPEGEPVSADYTVTLDGRPVNCYTCRVSAMPFNRWWPGYQRSKDQTEIASFVNFAMTGPAEVTVTLPKDFTEGVLRPLTKKVPLIVEGRTARFTIRETGFYSLEIDGRHGNLHIFADTPERNGYDGGKITHYYGPGIHEAGLIELQSGDTLYIDTGAVVHGMVRASDAENIRILGHGILDQSRYERGTFQSGIISLSRCSDVLIRDIILRDSSAWTITAINCHHVLFDNLRAIGMWRYNADGFDFVNCQNVHLTNSFLRTFDDGVVLKGIRTGTPSAELQNVENILVDNCVLWCDWGGALEIGAETVADEYKNITFRNIDILRNDSGGCRIQSGDRADIHDVLYENIRVEYSRYDTAPRLQNSDDEVYTSDGTFHVPPAVNGWMYCNMWTKDGILGHVHDITYRNIQVLTDPGMPMPPVTFSGADADHRFEHILIDGFFWNGQRVEPDIRKNEFAGKITVL